MKRYANDYQTMLSSPAPLTGTEFLKAIQPFLTAHQMDLIEALLTQSAQQPGAAPDGAPAPAMGAAPGAPAPAAPPMGAMPGMPSAGVPSPEAAPQGNPMAAKPAAPSK